MDARRTVIKDCELILGDCVETLGTLPPIAICVADPPYSSGGLMRSDRNQEMNAIRNRDLPWEELEWANCQLEMAIARERSSSRTESELAKREERAKPISITPSKDPYGEPEITVNADAIAASASAKSKSAPCGVIEETADASWHCDKRRETFRITD